MLLPSRQVPRRTRPPALKPAPIQPPRRRGKRLQIRQRNSPGQAGAARIVPLDHGLIPCPILLAGPPTFWRPLRLTTSPQWTVIAVIGFVLLARREYRDCAGPAWTTLQRELARVSDSLPHEAVGTVWFAR